MTFAGVESAALASAAVSGGALICTRAGVDVDSGSIANEKKSV